MKRTHRKLAVVAASTALLGLPLAGCGTNGHLAATPLVRVVHRATHRVAWKASPIPYEMVARPVVDQAVQVPILMYHDATYLPGDSLGLAPGQFVQEMRFLHDQHFHTINFGQLYGAMYGGYRLPSRPILVTFDDGYASVYSTALPVLRKYGFQATVFMIAGWTGIHHKFPMLTWSQLVAMQRSGTIDVESHTVHHVDLKYTDTQVTQQELVDSARLLAAYVHHPIAYFCYPSGGYTAQTMGDLRRAGYLLAVTEHPGYARASEGAYGLSRLRVYEGMSLQGFRTLLAPSFGPSVRVLGLRKFPYPYRAMLSISSDADHQTLRKFTMIHEFLNTHAMTPMGKGLGLDISDSFFLYNGSNLLRTIDYRRTPLDEEMTYFNGISDRPYDAALIQRYILHGWIDTLHSFGDFSLRDPFQTKFSRRLAVQALQALAVAGDHLTVWTDHGNQSNVDDFGSYGKSGFYRYQQGANPQSPYHVTDLLVPYGVHFMWADQPSDAFGQYSMIYPKTLPDGRKVWGFWRYTNTSFSARGTPDWTWSVGDLARQMTIQHLLQIENLHQYAILAQHLSANDALDPLPPNAIDALHLLANQYHAGHILVARTSRLLTYNVAQQYVRFRVTQTGHFAVIHITAIADPVFGTHRPTVSALRGVTFYTTNPGQTQLDIGNTPVPVALVQRNETDGIAPSIGIKWYPSDTRDYAVWDRSVRRT